MVVGERFKFHSVKQNQGESINDYATQLKQLSVYCEFEGDQLKQNLRDKFVCGLASDATQKKLLSKSYTFDQALSIALAEETASKSVTNIGGGSMNTVGCMNYKHNHKEKPQTSYPHSKCDICYK